MQNVLYKSGCALRLEHRNVGAYLFQICRITPFSSFSRVPERGSRVPAHIWINEQRPGVARTPFQRQASAAPINTAIHPV